MHEYKPAGTPDELVRAAMANPIGTPTLAVMAEGKKKVVVICSDHTRPVPSKVIIPPMLEEIRKGSPTRTSPCSFPPAATVRPPRKSWSTSSARI